MPELPEVETVVRDLRPLLAGRSVAAARRASDRPLRRPWRDEWAARLAGLCFLAPRRRGKWIVLPFSAGPALLVHLGMTGQLTVHAAADAVPTHLHLSFDLDDGRQLRYRDVRRFGSATLFDDEASLRAFVEDGLGPEPFEMPRTAWRAALAATRRAVKAVLLDQSVVAGVGNIYADEALFRARLHPARRADHLSRPQADRLLAAVVEVLNAAIQRRGSTIRDYVGGSGLMGGFQDEFLAYGRDGRPCSRCGVALCAARVAGRSSHFCPGCQRPEGPRTPATP